MVNVGPMPPKHWLEAIYLVRDVHSNVTRSMRMTVVPQAGDFACGKTRFSVKIVKTSKDPNY